MEQNNSQTNDGNSLEGRFELLSWQKPATKWKFWKALGDHGSKIHSHDASTGKSDSR